MNANHHGATVPHLHRVPGGELRRRPRDEFSGLDYRRASLLAHDLLQRAAETGEWFALPEALVELRGLMEDLPAPAFRSEYMGL